MSVILLILKIIGIILLFVLGFLLAILLLVLLWPVTYRVGAEIDKPDVKALATIRWFIASISVSFIDKKLDVRAKILGIKVLQPGGKKNKQAEKTDNSQGSQSDGQDDNNKTTLSEADNKDTLEVHESSQAASVVNEGNKPPAEDFTDELEIIKKEMKANDDSSIKEDSDNPTGEMPEKKLTEKIKEKAVSIYDKLIRAANEAEGEKKDVDLFLKRKTTKKSIELIKSTLIKLLLHIRPRRMEGELMLGMSDPATTGYITAIMSLICTCTEESFEFTPSFEEEIIRGRIKAKGHIVLGYIVLLALNAIIRKSFRRFIKNSMAQKDGAFNRVDKIKEIFSGG